MILQVILFIIYIIKLIKHTLRLNIQNNEKLKMIKKLQIFCVILFMSVTNSICSSESYYHKWVYIINTKTIFLN